MPIIQKHYPDTLIRVAGFNLTNACKSVLAGRVYGTSYGFYLQTLVHKYGLEKNIQFVGNLNELEIKDMYLKSHVYVNASALENSSNSIGEAQLLGVPVVASFVGGTDTIVKNNETGLLYPSDDVVRLAAEVVKIFNDANLACELSKKEIIQAKERHSKEKKRIRLLDIYKTVQKTSNKDSI